MHVSDLLQSNSCKSSEVSRFESSRMRSQVELPSSHTGNPRMAMTLRFSGVGLLLRHCCCVSSPRSYPLSAAMGALHSPCLPGGEKPSFPHEVLLALELELQVQVQAARCWLLWGRELPVPVALTMVGRQAASASAHRQVVRPASLSQ